MIMSCISLEISGTSSEPVQLSTIAMADSFLAELEQFGNQRWSFSGLGHLYAEKLVSTKLR